MQRWPKLFASLRWFVLVVAGLATLGVATIVTVNWLGDRAWAQYEAEHAAKGDPIDQPAPPIVSDADDLLKAPILMALSDPNYAGPEHTLIYEKSGFRSYLNARLNDPLRDRVDYRAALRKAGVKFRPDTNSPANDLLVAIKPLDPLLDAIGEAVRQRSAISADFQGPASRFDYGLTFNAVKLLTLRAALRLETSQADAAFSDVITLERLANTLVKSRPTIMQSFVAMGAQSMAIGVIQHGCDLHQWEEAQLGEFQRLAAGHISLRTLRSAFTWERARIPYAIDSAPGALFERKSPPIWFIHGLAQYNKLTSCRDMDEVIQRIPVSDENLNAEEAQQPALARHWHDSFTHIVVQKWGNLVDTFASQIEHGRLYQVACAIERFRLARGSYPDSLDQLVPRYLPAVPKSIFDGHPVDYTQVEGRRRLSIRARDPMGGNDKIAFTIPAIP